MNFEAWQIEDIERQLNILKTVKKESFDSLGMSLDDNELDDFQLIVESLIRSRIHFGDKRLV